MVLVDLYLYFDTLANVYLPKTEDTFLSNVQNRLD